MRKNTIYDTLQAKKAAFDGYKVSIMDYEEAEYKKLVEGSSATGQTPYIDVIKIKEKNWNRIKLENNFRIKKTNWTNGGMIMCKVLIKNPNKNVDFIIYNHLFSQDPSYTFTVGQLVLELRRYKLDISTEYVEKEVDSFIKSGLINQKFRCYSVCGR